MALVLTRKLLESVVIDGRIVVQVVDIDAGKVRLAFTAPPEVSVHRQEIHDRIQAEKRAGTPDA